MAVVKGGPVDWRMSRSKTGHRTYKVRWLVFAATIDGPASVLTATGLPRPGSIWSFPGDVDSWAVCTNEAEVAVAPEYSAGEAAQYWIVEQTFSTEGNPFNPHDLQTAGSSGGSGGGPLGIENPLLERPKVSGTFTKYTVEATTDRFGNPLTNSAHEPLRGPAVEFDANRPSIHIEQNVATFYAAATLPYSMRDTVNKKKLWGCRPRCVKLSNVAWDKKYFAGAIPYYSRILDFDIDPETFDRDILDEGTKMLNGRWLTNHTYQLVQIDGVDPDKNVPSHFIRAKDAREENIHMVLNGAGLPASVMVGSGRKFISIQNLNQDFRLSNDDWWLPVSTTLIFADMDEWSPENEYPKGSMVRIGGNIHIAVDDSGSWDPHDPELGEPEFWLILGAGGPFFPNDRGDYNSGTSYNIGDYVVDRTGTSPGYRRISKYKESDFLKLGIPSVL